MNPVIKECSYVLIHVPDFVRYGSKPSREIEKNPALLSKIEELSRSYFEAESYPPNQVFIGNLEPDALREIPRPWFKNLAGAFRFGKFGEIMPEDEFYGLLKLSGVRGYDLVWLEKEFTARIKEKLTAHPLFNEADLKKIGDGKTIEEIKEKIQQGKCWSLPLFHNGKLIGCFNRSQDTYAYEDESLSPQFLMESLFAKASGVLALKSLLKKSGLNAGEIDYILNCSEEAAGDRYNRGGGSLAKAIGESCGCDNSSGADIKAFCVAPMYALFFAANLIKTGAAKKIVVVGGGCSAKLGMRIMEHLKNNMPALEDVIAGMAFLITRDDGENPIIRLDAVGSSPIGAGASQEDILKAIVSLPLKKIGKKITDIEKYALQLENPEITEPARAGNIPKNNYMMLATLAMTKGEITREEREGFIKKYGMEGFSPTQGHIPSGAAYIGHAVDNIKSGKIKRAMIIGKGSLFLARLTDLWDGVSIIIEKNPKKRRWWKCLKEKRS